MTLSIKICWGSNSQILLDSIHLETNQNVVFHYCQEVKCSIDENYCVVKYAWLLFIVHIALNTDHSLTFSIRTVTHSITTVVHSIRTVLQPL